MSNFFKGVPLEQDPKYLQRIRGKEKEEQTKIVSKKEIDFQKV